MKKIFYSFLLIILLMIPSWVKADPDVNTDGSGTADVRNDYSSVNSNWGFSPDNAYGIRITVIDETGNRISQNTVDYWGTNSIPSTQMRQMPGSSYKTDIVNKGGLSFTKLDDFSNYSYPIGNPNNIAGIQTNSWMKKHDNLQRIIETNANSESCRNPLFLDELGFDICEYIQNGECEELNKIYILIEPLVRVSKSGIYYVFSGTELVNYAPAANSHGDINDHDYEYIFGGTIYRNLMNMYLSEESMNWQLKSGNSKYSYWEDGTKPVETEGKEKKNMHSETSERLNLFAGKTRDANGNVWGSSMQLIWLGDVVENCPPPEEEGECCVPCDPEDSICITNAGDNYHHDDPNCCLEYENISTDGTIEACVPWDTYWNGRGDYEEVCPPTTCIPDPDDPTSCCDVPGWCDQPENKEYCEEYCPTKCLPLQLNGTSYCKTADCDGENNVSVFADPILSEFVKNGSADAEEIINKFSNLTEEQVKDLIAPENNTFLAVAKVGGETYKTTIGTYCDLYCQEIAIVTLPDVYPAANAGRYFQWGISSEEPGTIVTQEIVKVCAEDIKYDDFIRDYQTFNRNLIDSISNAVNYSSYHYCGPISVTGGGLDCSTISEIDFKYCEASCLNAERTCERGKEKNCWEKYTSCVDDTYNPDSCVNIKANSLDSCNEVAKAYENTIRNIKEGRARFDDTFNDFLSCFSNEIGDEIVTDLNLSLYYGDETYDSINSYEKIESEIKTMASNYDCLISDECNPDNYFSVNNSLKNICGNNEFILPATFSGGQVNYGDAKTSQIVYTVQFANNRKIFYGAPYYDSFTLKTGNLTAEDLEKKISEIDYKVETSGDRFWNDTNYIKYYDILNDNPNLNYFKNNDSEYYERAKNAASVIDNILDVKVSDYLLCADASVTFEKKYPKCKEVKDVLRGVGTDAYAKSGYILPQTFNGLYYNSCKPIANIYDNSSYNAFPLKVTDWNSDSWQWKVDSNFFTNKLTNIDYKQTIRLVALSKTDKYQLKDNINACTCSDGTVMDAIVKDGEFICDCEPEVNEINEGDYSYSESGAGLIETDRYGKCEYWGYSINKLGGTYKVEYMSGSGNYPLSIEYSNIGSIKDGKGHFSDMLDVCGENCSGDSCTYDGDACKLVVGNSIMVDYWPGSSFSQGWSLKSDYFVCKGGECIPPYPLCPEGDCGIVIPPPDPPCSDGDCHTNIDDVKGLSLVYRTIDLNNPFPGDDIDSERTAGENWQGHVDRIKSNRGLSGNELYSSNEVQPLYYFKFTPSLIKEIRAYNASVGRDYATSSTIAYPNNRLTNDDGSYNVGFSYILRHDISKIVADTAAANGDSTDEWIKVPTSKEKCREGYEEFDDWCYAIADAWEDVGTEITYQGDEACWDLARTYLGGE